MAPPRCIPAIAAALTAAGAILGAGCGSGTTAAAPATTAAPPGTPTSAADSATIPAPVTTRAVTVVAPPPAPPAQVDEADGRDRGGVGGGGGGHGGGGDAPVQLPPGWPADLYLPPGSLQSAQGAVGHWTAMLLVSGNAQRALDMAEQYFRSAGYAQLRSGVLQRGSRRVTIVTENLDHSDARTTLVVSADG